MKLLVPSPQAQGRFYFDLPYTRAWLAVGCGGHILIPQQSDHVDVHLPSGIAHVTLVGVPLSSMLHVSQCSHLVNLHVWSYVCVCGEGGGKGGRVEIYFEKKR